MVEDEVLTDMTRETCLQMFINCMPSRYRAVFTLRVMLKLTVAQTADVLEISSSAVKVYLHRARKVARDHINGRCSLIQEGAMCNCRSYAGFIEATGRQHLLCDIETVRDVEKKAVREYGRELDELSRIEQLYNCRIKAPDTERFISGIRKLKSEKRLRLLGD